MKILHVMAGLQPSGMERMLLSSADHWARFGIRCEILATAREPGTFEAQLRTAGYAVHHIPFRSRCALLPNLPFLRRYSQLCRGFDLIHIHTEEAMVLFTWLARTAHVRRVALTVHNVFTFTGSLRLRKNVERKIVRALGGRFGFVSDAVANNERVRFHNNGVRITNWVDTLHFLPPTLIQREEARQSVGLSSTEKVILTVGNCNAAKNHGALLEGLALLVERDTLLYLHVGREEQGQPERLQAERLGLSGQVRFLGPQEDVLPWLWAADLFVMPSNHEGLALAPLEAIASACPSLLTRVDGLAELSIYAPSLAFAQPGPASLAEAIRDLFEIPSLDLRERVLNDSVAVRAHFSPEAGVDTLCRMLYLTENQGKQFS